MSDEIEKIESEGLAEEDISAELASEIETEQDLPKESSTDPDDLDSESVEELSEAYTNAVAESAENESEPEVDDTLADEPGESDDIETSEEDSQQADGADTESANDEADNNQESDIEGDSTEEEDEPQELSTDSVEPDESETESGPIDDTDSKPQGESETVESDTETEDSGSDTDDSNEEDSSAPEDSDDEDEEVSETDDTPSEISTCSVIEAILFAADEPVGARKLVEILNAGGVKEVKQHIKSLNKKYKKMDCAFRVEELAGGYQLLTLSAYKPWLSKLIKVRSESKLTAAAMETLSIIAYKQPIMRVEIENIRGVAAGEMIRQLIEKGLVKIVGRAEELGRPLLYGTTQKFLDLFGLGSLKDLPQPENQK